MKFYIIMTISCIKYVFIKFHMIIMGHSPYFHKAMKTSWVHFIAFPEGDPFEFFISILLVKNPVVIVSGLIAKNQSLVIIY